MYLISQLWWYLSLAFLMGALLGYLLWRLCSRPVIESRFERSREDMRKRLTLLEEENHRLISGEGVAGGGSDLAALRSELAAIKALAEKSSNDLALARDAENKLRADAGLLQKQIAILKTEAQSKGLEAAKSAGETVEARQAKPHADELKALRDTLTAELNAKHAVEIKKMRGEVASALAAAQDAKALIAASKSHESEVLSLSNAASTTKRDMDEIRAAHANEIQKVRRDVLAEAEKRHNAEIEQLKRDHEAALAGGLANNGSARSAKNDELKLIWGIGGGIEKQLREHGISRFSQIAAWTAADVTRFESLIGNAHIASEKWVEQAAKLEGGWRPDAKDAGRPQDILTTPRGGKADDLKLIWGVGGKLEKMLNDAGFYHFDQIAKWTDQELAWVDRQLGEFAGRAVRDKWVEQCQKLATGWRPHSGAGDKPKNV